MTEGFRPSDVPLEDRKRDSAIHQTLDIDTHFDNIVLPDRLREPLHEILIAGSNAGPNAVFGSTESRAFAKTARQITIYYEISPLDSQVLQIHYLQIVSLWRQALRQQGR